MTPELQAENRTGDFEDRSSIVKCGLLDSIVNIFRCTPRKWEYSRKRQYCSHDRNRSYTLLCIGRRSLVRCNFDYHRHRTLGMPRS